MYDFSTVARAFLCLHLHMYITKNSRFDLGFLYTTLEPHRRRTARSSFRVIDSNMLKSPNALSKLPTFGGKNDDFPLIPHRNQTIKKFCRCIMSDKTRISFTVKLLQILILKLHWLLNHELSITQPLSLFIIIKIK